MTRLRDNTQALLSERITRLDDATLRGPRHAIEQFVAVMSSITHTQLTSSPNATPSPLVDPQEADRLVASCELLDAIAAFDETLVVGPLDVSRQEWVADTPRPSVVRYGHVPTVKEFRAPCQQREIPHSTKPFNLGLYTSTRTPHSSSMWRVYLEEYGGGPVLLPRPWYSWRLCPVDRELRICEIASARDWTRFVSSFPAVDGVNVYPDWKSAADVFDGVHVTARAIVAIQGFEFWTPVGHTAPAYWDVESTFWLRWSFADAALVEVVP
jgi:hypothetical protein